MLSPTVGAPGTDLSRRDFAEATGTVGSIVHEEGTDSDIFADLMAAAGCEG